MRDPKAIPLGPPLDLTDEQLDQLAEVMPADIERAKVFWRANAPEEFKDLLDAETIDEEPEP
jgi:hypothetical protein